MNEHSDIKSQPHGVQYLEIVSNDVEASRRLYAQAYGFHFQAIAPELGGAYVAEIPGGSLCGIRAPMHPQESPMVRTYLRVFNIEDAVKSAAALGAKILLEPVDIAGRGTIAIYACGGVEQGLWQVFK